jgi:hypothetical protein
MASYYDQISSLNPKIWYKFDETAGTPNNSGSLSTTSTFNNLLLNEATDVDGRAVYFNGTSSNIILPAHPAFSLFDDRSFTIETWVKASQTDVSSIFQPILFNAVGGASNRYVSLELAGSARPGTPGRVVWIANNGSGNYREIVSATRVDDNDWHHIVAVHNTTSMKVYIDGQLSITGTPLGSANFDIDIQTNKKVIGQAFGANGTNYKGRIDEFAVYDYELSAAQVLANYNAGATVDFADVPGTATALFVDPTLITEAILTADPMTASSASGDHYVSNYDVVPPLESYLESLTLDQYIKFTEYHSARNYALNQSSNQPAITFYGNADNVIDGGLQLSGVIKFVGSGTTGRIIMNQTAVNNELTDGNFVLGCWLKIPSISDSRNIITSYDTQNPPQGIRLDLNSAGQLQFQIENNQVHTITGTDVIDDDQWHFVVLKVSNSNYSIWVDDVQDASGTFNGSYPGSMVELGFGSNNIGSRTGFINLSHFFIGSTSNVTTGILTNIYNYGQEEIHAKAIMNAAVAKFDSSYNDKVVSLNPTLDFRLNEGSGANIVTDSVKALVANIQGTARTSGVATRNNRGINFTDLDTRYVGTYAAPSGTFSSANKQSISVFFKTNGVQDDWDRICSTGMESLNGLSIETSPSGRVLLWSWTDDFYLEIRTASDTVVNGQWHHVVGVKDGDNAYIYFDGKLAASDTMQFTLSDTIRAAIGGIGVVEYNSYDYSAARNTTIDEFAIFPTALSAQEAFELYQSISMEMDTTASASLPMPTFEVGTGPTILADPMTASAEQLDPSISAPFLEAFAEFLMPNFGTTVVIDVNYGHTAATADALFHDPQFNIGDEHSADHMDASAEMLDPIIITPGNFRAPVLVAQDATLVDPGIVTVQGAQVFAEPAIANSFFPLPPAYLQLTDDQWYVRLFAQHAQQNIEPKFNTTTGQPATQIAKTVLKFFDDVTSSITVGNGYLENDLEEKIFEAPGSTNTTKTKIYPSIAANLTPTPALYEGYFDDFGRKAVRVNNIEFEMPEEIYNSQLPFSLEFSIKTTKANQIIAKGKWKSFLYTQKSETGFGLYDGKLYMMTSNTTSGVPGNRTAHPANPDMAGNPYMIGRKNIADGQWHHIIVQYGFTDNRIQFWVDGQLDRQLIEPGLRNARLYVMGSNNAITIYQSDFETSAWSYDKQAFISEQDVDLNYIGYLKYEPIKAEPMKATITMTANNLATGNRGRAIVFYFWPEDTDGIIARNPLEITNPGGPTFDTVVSTDDYFRQPPQQWYDWDLYPVDVTGRYVSELVKPEAYGVGNIKIQEPSFTILTGRENPAQYAYKVNTRGYFTDPITDARRYIDVFNDIDLSQFDAIFFKNYPEESIERDAYTREDFADEYFNLRERELFDKFLVSLRKGLDTGISLFVTNHQLAVDLGIVDRVENVTNIHEGDFTTTDAYVTARIAPNGAIIPRTSGDYLDLHKNNRHRVVNTLENLTNDPGYIWKDWFYFENDDTVDYGGPNRPYTKIEYRPNGLQVGDEFIISDERLRASYSKAAPIANVKAGKVITTFSNQILQNNTAVDNPFKNYATTIAVEPGTILNGKPTVGKIFVAFTEGFDREDKDYTREYFGVDLIQDEFINRAYQDGEISLAKRDELLASPDNLDRRLEAAIIAGNQTLINEINKLKYWTSNGDYILTQKILIDDPTGSGVEKEGLGVGFRRGRINKVNKKGALSTQTVASSLQWFALTYAYQFERAQFAAASMLTRGIRWLSDKIVDDGLVNRVQVMNATIAELPMPLVVADNDMTVYAQAMLSNATILTAEGYALQDVEVTTLPLFAEADFGAFVKNIYADVFNASSLMKDPRISGIEEDEVVVYIIHVDPILYLREDIIK